MRYVPALIVFAIGEAVGLLIFSLLRDHLGPEEGSAAFKGATAKGILERLVLFTGLLHGFPQIIIAFGAMKLGTRLHEEQGSNISNTYFLVGNLTSMFLAMLYAIITQHLWRG